MVTCDEDPAPPATRLLSASLACGRITIQDIFIAIQGYFIAIKGTFWRLERPQPPASSDLGVRDIGHATKPKGNNAEMPPMRDNRTYRALWNFFGL
jgi:hypothetical protein